MRSFIKKDLLIIWRDRKEMILSILLPVLLIIVLNFAFAGLFSADEESSMDLQLAIVNQDDERKAMEQLEGKLASEASLGEPEIKAAIEQASAIQPVQLLLDFMESEELKDIVTVHTLEETEAMEKVEDGKLDAMLFIPVGYSADSLYAAFTGASPAVPLIFKLEKETNNSSALYQIIQGFTDQLNDQFAIQKLADPANVEVKLPEGGFEEIGAGKTFTMLQYFTIAMSVLFALFLVATVGSKTGVEIREQVFNRILLSNSHPIQFLIGKIVSTICLVLLQMLFVIIVSHFMLGAFEDRSLTFWLGFAVMISLFALAMSALAAFFTSISLRVSDIDAANGIFMIAIILFGTIGGNFVPIYLLPDWLQQFGQLTPNGLFLEMMTEWIQFEQPSAMVWPGVLLFGFSIVFTIIGLMLFPKRGEAK